MIDPKMILTHEGVKKLTEELRQLIDVERPKVIEELTFARSQGDLSENADYDAARNRQAEVEGRIKQIEDMLATAKIVDDKPKNNKVVAIGSKVVIFDTVLNKEETYTIVGTVEANPFHKTISNLSALGSALIGKRVDDLVMVPAVKPYQVRIVRIESK